jgi:arylformamidase
MFESVSMKKIIITGGIGLLIVAGLYYAKKYKRSILPKSFLTKLPEGQKLSMRFQPNSPKAKYDLTAKIDPSLVVYPGDPTFKMEPITEIGVDHCSFKLCQLSFGNHTGTHIDFPRHTISGGQTSDDYSLDDLMGNGIVIEVPETFGAVNHEFVSQHPDLRDKIIFFKTRNSQLSKHQPYHTNYVYIEPEAAQYLVEQGVKIVGIDYISVDPETAHTLPAHNTLLSKGVLIVENLELRDIPAGNYTIYIAPLNIREADGVPVRVWAEK